MKKHKKYFNVYLKGIFSAIIKDEKDLHDYLIDRATVGEYAIQRDKLSPLVEEFSIFARYNPDADIVETLDETRYRDIMIAELYAQRKKCKKKLRKIEDKLSEYKKNSREYRRLKSEHKMIKHMMNTVLNVDVVQDAISDTIIHQPSAVKEYLENYEIIRMMARGEI